MPKLFSVFVFALVFVFTGNLSALAANSFAPGDVVPFTLHRGHMIVVKCAVGGLRDLTAVVDTGASETVLDMEVVRQLSLAIQPDSATFITHQANVWAVAIPRLELGPIAVDRLQGIGTDLSSLTAELGIRPQVLIGMDVLRRSSFLIDYRSHRLVFGPPPRLAHSAPLLSPVSGNSEGSCLRFAVIESTTLGHKLRLQVDSGFEGVLLYRRRVPGLSRDGVPSAATFGSAGFSSEDAHIANVAQQLRTQSFTSPDVEIGNWHAPHAQLSVVDGPVPDSAEFDGLLGTAFLSRQRVAFDFENGMISWQ